VSVLTDANVAQARLVPSASRHSPDTFGSHAHGSATPMEQYIGKELAGIALQYRPHFVSRR